ncbi:MAG: hypothetical protein ACLFO4_02580 [Candidatus Acetothermia bacterium]
MSWFVYNLIGLTLRLGIKPFFDLQVDGLENYSETPSSLIVANHKRDLDSVLIASVFFYHEGYLRPATPVSFMGDENLFQPGFLADWIKGPTLLKKALQPVSLNGILQRLNAYPIGKLDFHSVPVHEALRIIQDEDDDPRLSEVIEEEPLKEMLEDTSFGSPEMRISEFFEKEGYPRKKVKSGYFEPEYRQAVKKTKLRAVKKQLDKFIELLNEGAILYITPEGRLSRNGALGKLKDSLLILVDEVEAGVVVVPTNITYDFTRKGRTKIFVQVGEERRGLEELDREEKSRTLRKNILSLTTINLGQLASYKLVKAKESGREKISEEEVHRESRNYLEKFQEAGFNLDDDLSDRKGFEARWRSFLGYCERRGVLEPEESGRGDILILDPDLGYRKNTAPRGYLRDPIKYSANEIRALEKVGLIEL